MDFVTIRRSSKIDLDSRTAIYKLLLADLMQAYKHNVTN